jgi:hypothetical protein
MKEVFTKSFWQGVNKTFHEALEDSPPADNALRTPAEGDPNASSNSGAPSSSATPSAPLASGGTSELLANTDDSEPVPVCGFSTVPQKRRWNL